MYVYSDLRALMIKFTARVNKMHYKVIIIIMTFKIYKIQTVLMINHNKVIQAFYTLCVYTK